MHDCQEFMVKNHPTPKAEPLSTRVFISTCAKNNQVGEDNNYAWLLQI